MYRQVYRSNSEGVNPGQQQHQPCGALAQLCNALYALSAYLYVLDMSARRVRQGRYYLIVRPMLTWGVTAGDPSP